MRKTENPPIRLRDIKVSARDQLMIDPKMIAIEMDFNPRNYNLPENRDHLDELKRSIGEVGVKVPLLVRWDMAARQCVLVDGECRLRAVLELINDGTEILAVPTVQVPGDNEPERLITSLTANTGKPLSKWEIGIAFRRFIGWGWDTAKIAKRMGYTERYVKESLELSDAPEDVKQLLSEQAVTPSLALQHIRADGAAAGEKLRGKVEKAKSVAKERTTSKPSKSGKGKRGRPAKEKKVIARREKKSDRVSFSMEDVAKILKAVKFGCDVIGDSTLKTACEEALGIINNAMHFN